MGLHMSGFRMHICSLTLEVFPYFIRKLAMFIGCLIAGYFTSTFHLCSFFVMIFFTEIIYCFPFVFGYDPGFSSFSNMIPSMY